MSHKDLDVWQQAIELSKTVYFLTGSFPKEELFGLSSQMRRAAVSIASNIAEGAARHGDREFLRFLHVAAGSASELDTQLEIAKGIKVGDNAQIDAVQESLEAVSKMLQGLIRSVKQRSIEH